MKQEVITRMTKSFGGIWQESLFYLHHVPTGTHADTYGLLVEIACEFFLRTHHG